MLGNPFDMQRDERLRDPVCDAFGDYFDAVIEGEEPVPTATRIARERNLTLAYAWKRPSREELISVLAILEERQRQGIPTAIQCFCAPKRCHLNKVKDWLDQKLEASLSSQEALQQEALPLKTHNPLRDLAPLNAAVALPIQKDIAMGDIATQFIGRSSAPANTPSSTRNYEREWAKQGLANTGIYNEADVVMVSGSGEFRGVTMRQIEPVFRGHFVPLLTKVVEARAQLLVGSASGNDMLVRAFLKERGYTFEPKMGYRGYFHCCPQREQERSSPTPSDPAVKTPAPNQPDTEAVLSAPAYEWSQQPVVDLEIGMIQAAEDICRGQRRGNQAIPTHIISIGSDTEAPPEGLDQFPGRVLRLEFDELDEPTVGLKTASREQLEAALAFGREARQAGGRLFVHCSAGVRRSPTIALALLADQLDRPLAVKETFRQLCPHALLIEATVKLTDTVLGTQLQETFLTVEPGRIDTLHTMNQDARTDIIIHSGGQTGADKGGLLGAEALGIQTGGVAPHGWLTEKGADPTLGTRFGLVEGPPGKSNAQTYVLCTKLNVQQTDGTVVFGSVDPQHDRGSALTLKLAEHGKPWIQFETQELYDSVTAGAELRSWLEEHHIRTLNVAGNRHSKDPLLESLVQTVIETACRAPFQSLSVVPCGLFIEAAVDWRAETEAIQTMLQQLAKRAVAAQEQLCLYCPDPDQRAWLQSTATDLTRSGTLVITGEAREWSPQQKSRLFALFQGTEAAQQDLAAAAAVGVDCLAFDCQQRTYFRVQAAAPQAQPQTVMQKPAQNQLER